VSDEVKVLERSQERMKPKPVMRFVCVACKDELIFPAGTPYEKANAGIGRRGWHLAKFERNKADWTWGLHCPKHGSA
jgi:hypothetical protein